MITINTSGLRIQFYCQNCCDDDERDDDGEDHYEVMDFYEFEVNGRPVCELCDRKMSSDFILIPPDSEPQPHHI
jgi:hypothetical protein